MIGIQGHRKVPNIGGAQGKLAHCKPLFLTIDIGGGTFPCATPVPTTLPFKHYQKQKKALFFTIDIGGRTFPCASSYHSVFKHYQKPKKACANDNDK